MVPWGVVMGCEVPPETIACRAVLPCDLPLARKCSGGRNRGKGRDRLPSNGNGSCWAAPGHTGERGTWVESPVGGQEELACKFSLSNIFTKKNLKSSLRWKLGREIFVDPGRWQEAQVASAFIPG